MVLYKNNHVHRELIEILKINFMITSIVLNDLISSAIFLLICSKVCLWLKSGRETSLDIEKLCVDVICFKITYIQPGKFFIRLGESN